VPNRVEYISIVYVTRKRNYRQTYRDSETELISVLDVVVELPINLELDRPSDLDDFKRLEDLDGPAVVDQREGQSVVGGGRAGRGGEGRDGCTDEGRLIHRILLVAES
jgi:hypothetical protein